MHAAVEAAIVPIRIAIDVRMKHRMIERGIEDAALELGPAAYLHPAQIRVPRTMRGRSHRVDIPGMPFGAKVRASAVEAHPRQADLNVHRRIDGRVERDIRA